jgi:hypothetical protein
MAPSKKSKAKKPPPPPTSEPTVNPNDDDLVDDLIAQLDSLKVVTEPTAAPDNTACDKPAESLGSTQKQGAKSRFKARQVSLFYSVQTGTTPLTDVMH